MELYRFSSALKDLTVEKDNSTNRAVQLTARSYYFMLLTILWGGCFLFADEKTEAQPCPRASTDLRPGGKESLWEKSHWCRQLHTWFPGVLRLRRSSTGKDEIFKVAPTSSGALLSCPQIPRTSWEEYFPAKRPLWVRCGWPKGSSLQHKGWGLQWVVDPWGNFILQGLLTRGERIQVTVNLDGKKKKITFLFSLIF